MRRVERGDVCVAAEVREHGVLLGADQVEPSDADGSSGCGQRGEREQPAMGISDSDGNDTNTCGAPDCGRPMRPALFITDLASSNQHGGDWQYHGDPTAGGLPNPPPDRPHP